MADPKWDDTEDVDMEIPSFDDTEEIEPISKLESGLRGAGQGVTVGFLDEMMAAFGTKGASPSQIIAEPEKAIETEKKMFQDYEANLAEERALNAAAQEANPLTYGASEIVGGIAPGLVTGGGAAAANIAKAGATQGVKAAVGGAVKEGAKLGAKFGAVSGAGYSEGETPLEVAGDVAIGTAIGGAAGAALPLGIEGAKTGAKKLLTGTQNLAAKIPGGELARAAYKFGKQGKGISTNQLDDDLERVATKVYDNIKVKKKANDLIKVKDELDKLGFAVDTKATVQTTIDKLKKLKNKDFLDENNQEILGKLEKFAGIDKDRQKMIDSLTKKLIKKEQQSASKTAQSVISGEKSLAKEAAKSGDSLESVTDTIKRMDDLEIPFDTSKGQLSGVTGRFKKADGEEYSKQILKDTTDFQPEINELNIGGRTVLNTKDLGSGKVESIVGNVKNAMDVDLEKMSIQDVDYLRDSLQVVIDGGNFKDPNIRAAAELSKTLQELSDAVVKKYGSSDLINRRETFSNIFSAEDLLGIRKNIGGKLGDEAKITQLMSRLTQEGNVKQRRELKIAKDLLGEDVLSPENSSQLDMINKLIPNAKVDADGNISRTGLFKQVIGKGPNLVGQAVNKVTTPISKVANKVNLLTSEQLTSFAGKLSASDKQGVQMLGNRLTEAMSKEGPAQSQAIWALSQSPAFRELVRRNAAKSDTNLNQIGDDIIDAVTPEEAPRNPDQGSEVENSVMTPEVSREPSSLEDIDQGFIKGLEGTKRDAYVPNNGGKVLGNSGVTIASGLDLGQRKHLDDIELSAEIKAKLTPYLGVKKEAALELVNNSPLNLSQEEVEEIDSAVEKAYYEKASKRFDSLASGKKFDDLPPQVQTALYSLQYNTGSIGSRTIQAASNDDNYDDLVDELYNYYPENSEMSGNFAGKRRKVEADYIKNNTQTPEAVVEEVLEEEEISIEEVESTIDRVNQQQSSGEAIPMNQLDQLLRNINKLKLSEEVIDELEVDATNMVGFNDGMMLKEKIKKLQGL